MLSQLACRRIPVTFASVTRSKFARSLTLAQRQGSFVRGRRAPRTRLSSHPQTAVKRYAHSVPVIYVEPDGEEREVEAEVGKNLLDIAHDNNIDLEGACGGELACATCHLIFEKDIYDTLPDKVDEEDDMLDLAFELTDTSRLGCQICVREDFAGIRVRIPDDGY